MFDSRNWVNGADPDPLCPNVQHYPPRAIGLRKKALTEESRKMTREGATCNS